MVIQDFPSLLTRLSGPGKCVSWRCPFVQVIRSWKVQPLDVGATFSKFWFFLWSRLTRQRDKLAGSAVAQLWLEKTSLLIYFSSLLIWNFKVLCQWLMDQVPLGNKTPRPGYARQIWCPACRGLLQYPLSLTSGHVLTECMVVEGTCIGISWACGCLSLQIVQVQESVKVSEHSLTSVPRLEGARRLLITSMSTGWIPRGRNCLSRFTCREEQASRDSPTCGWTRGERRRRIKFLMWNRKCLLAFGQYLQL